MEWLSVSVSSDGVAGLLKAVVKDPKPWSGKRIVPSSL